MPNDMNKKIRRDFYNLMIGKGLAFWVMIRRVRKDIKCRCYSENKFGESLKTCPNCYGRGYLFQDIPVLAYYSQVGTPTEADFKAVILNNTKEKFYFMHDVELTKSDLILKVKLTDSGKIKLPIERIAYFEIESYRGFSAGRGVPAFWVANVADVTDNWQGRISK